MKTTTLVIVADPLRALASGVLIRTVLGAVLRAAPLLADASGRRGQRHIGLFSTWLRMTSTAQTLAVICQSRHVLKAGRRAHN
jgi:hypothetical protein